MQAYAQDRVLDAVLADDPRLVLVLDSSSELHSGPCSTRTTGPARRLCWTRNPRNGSRKTGSFSTGSLNQLLPRIKTNDFSVPIRDSARHVSSHCVRPAETYTARTGSLLGNQCPGNDQRSSTARIQSQCSDGMVGRR